MERIRALVERARRWCPDANSEVVQRTVERIAHEQAAAAGLTESFGFARPTGWPSGPERELLEAAEELLTSEGIDLLDGIRPTVDPHPLGGAWGPAAATCGTCTWRWLGRCQSWRRDGSPAPQVKSNLSACFRWEPILGATECGSCGACCREGYTHAPVRRGEAVLTAHPEWIRRDGRLTYLPRPEGKCVALDGSGSVESPWKCKDYEVRPKACSELRPGSLACLSARRRTGLSR